MITAEEARKKAEKKANDYLSELDKTVDGLVQTAIFNDELEFTLINIPRLAYSRVRDTMKSNGYKLYKSSPGSRLTFKF